MIPIPNQSGAVFGATPGIARKLDLAGPSPMGAPGEPQGGGDLNGTQATSILYHHAGTGLGPLNLPRLGGGPGLGVVDPAPLPPPWLGPPPPAPPPSD